jgi:hypothetical protein
MATFTTSGFPIAVTDPISITEWRRKNYRRQVPASTSRGLSLIGHAVEYLAEEFLRDSVPPSAHNERLQAIQLLMDLSQQIYLECPEVPVFAERCRIFVRSLAA